MRIHLLLFSALFGLCAATSFAEVTEYDIEIVIFEDTSARYLGSEQWPRIEHALPVTETESAVVDAELPGNSSAASADSDNVIKITDLEPHMLGAYASKIDSSPRYNVLVHKSWRQAGLDAESAIEVEIDSRPDTRDNNAQQRLRKLDIAIDDTAEGMNEQIESSITGNVKVTLGRYLHIYTDLIYKKPASYHALEPVSLEDSRYSEFLVKTHRRMRSKELHYLDHPMVGILVMALPVEVNEDEPVKDETQANLVQ